MKHYNFLFLMADQIRTATLEGMGDGIQTPNLRRLMDECAERKDYQGLFVVQCQVAETVLWDCTHVDLWLANLESILREWQKENQA